MTFPIAHFEDKVSKDTVDGENPANHLTTWDVQNFVNNGIFTISTG